MAAIFKRECKSYFTGILGYLLCAFLIAVNGLYFWAMNMNYGQQDLGYYTLYRTMFVFLIFVPILTMRSISEERKNRTDQLLLTSPISTADVIVGKYLGMLVLYAIPCVVFAVMILVLRIAGASGTMTLYNFGCLLAYFLLGAAAIAVGEFVSGLTDNMLVAAVCTFALLLLSYLMPSIQSLFTAGSVIALIVFIVVLVVISVLVGIQTRSLLIGAVVGAVGLALVCVLFLLQGTVLTDAFVWCLEKCSLFSPFEDFINQVFSIKDIIYYIAISVLFLFFSCQTLEKRRWNG